MHMQVRRRLVSYRPNRTISIIRNRSFESVHLRDGNKQRHKLVTFGTAVHSMRAASPAESVDIGWRRDRMYLTPLRVYCQQRYFQTGCTWGPSMSPLDVICSAQWASPTSSTSVALHLSLDFLGPYPSPWSLVKAQATIESSLT
jgi:hypothetical protein